ncbi:Uncharacterised protein [Acinetobacter baumannii]|nr:Uncharacterised protein [Acinetobacter baumannii]
MVAMVAATSRVSNSWRTCSSHSAERSKFGPISRFRAAMLRSWAIR